METEGTATNAEDVKTEDAPGTMTEGAVIEWVGPWPTPEIVVRVVMGLRAEGKLTGKISIDLPKLAEISGETETALWSSNASLLKKDWQTTDQVIKVG